MRNIQKIGAIVQQSAREAAYTAIKGLTKGFLETSENGVRTAVLTNSKDEREIVYLIEDHGDGEVTVLQPWAPAAFAGSVKIVSRERINILEGATRRPRPRNDRINKILQDYRMKYKTKTPCSRQNICRNRFFLKMIL